MLDFTRPKFLVNEGTPERADIPLLRSLKRLPKASHEVKNTRGINAFVIQAGKNRLVTTLIISTRFTGDFSDAGDPSNDLTRLVFIRAFMNTC